MRPFGLQEGRRCVGSVDPTLGTRPRVRAGGRAANDICAWRSWRAGGCGERLERELGEETDYMLAMRLDRGNSEGRILVIKYLTLPMGYG